MRLTIPLLVHPIQPARKSLHFGSTSPSQNTPELFMHYQVEPNNGSTLGALVTRWFRGKQKSATYLGQGEFGILYCDKFLATHQEANSYQVEVSPMSSPSQSTPRLFMHHQVEPNNGSTFGALVTRWFRGKQKSATYLGHDQFGPVYADRFSATHLETNSLPEEKSRLFHLLNRLGSSNPKWYMELVDRSAISPNTLKLALYYLSKTTSNLRLDEDPDKSQEKKLLAMLILASKYHNDYTYKTKGWSELTGLPKGTIDKIEREALKHIEFGLYAPIQDFNVWNQHHGLNPIG